MRSFAIIIAFAIISAFLTGCAAMDPGRESDMPWNTPQSWEGSPMIPGMNN